MIPTIAHVDLQRVRDCLQGKVTHRGCGKTVAKVMLLISAALNNAMKMPTSSHTVYLYVGENGPHVCDVQRTAMRFLQDLRFDITSHSFGNGGINTYYRGRYIKFMFITPENMMCKIRGTRFKKVAIDLTPETHTKHARAIFEARQIYTI